MKFKIKTDVYKDLKKISNLPYDKALELSAQSILGQISENADKGKGYKGSFKPYSDKYKEKRTESGRGILPTLQYSGEMFRSLLNATYTAVKRGLSYIITLEAPNTTHSKSNATIADIVAGNMQKRPFFGINKTYVNKATKEAIAFLEAEFKRKV